ncbi:hypothetical protein OSB04_008311 [Centaurea solstitialis]|uniref:Retrotransposon Copia-like N-terminal domain-containing protein n=1 Tax=Centaurea solstitialis TaxID=347529 RepID=A0AA38WTT3_9ASTR|nr:hypothetical protein OSB04_008311 [Centaurea solstitialis]
MYGFTEEKITTALRELPLPVQNPVTAQTHFPIKLIASNFTVWRKQVQSTLIGLDLYKYLDGTLKPPSKVKTDKEKTRPNPDYLLWFRQDQIIISALLGSCSDSIQPIISSADTA